MSLKEIVFSRTLLDSSACWSSTGSSVIPVAELETISKRTIPNVERNIADVHRDIRAISWRNYVFFFSCCRDEKKRSAGCAQREKKHEWQDFAKGEALYINFGSLQRFFGGIPAPMLGLPLSLSREEDETFSVIAPCYNKWKGKSETTEISMGNGQLKIVGTKRTDERERERDYGFFLIVWLRFIHAYLFSDWFPT